MARSRLRSAARTVGVVAGSRTSDEEQGAGLGAGEAGQVGAATTEQAPPAAATLHRVDRESGGTEGVEVAGGALRDLEFGGDLAGGHLASLLEQQEDRDEPVGAHVCILVHKPAMS